MCLQLLLALSVYACDVLPCECNSRITSIACTQSEASMMTFACHDDFCKQSMHSIGPCHDPAPCQFMMHVAAHCLSSRCHQAEGMCQFVCTSCQAMACASFHSLIRRHGHTWLQNVVLTSAYICAVCACTSLHSHYLLSYCPHWR